MKNLNNYITEKLIINNTIQGYKYHPKNDIELVHRIQKKIDEEGYGTEDHPLDLNDIDTSKVEDMSHLFDVHFGYFKRLSKLGYFDISCWDTSKVTNMVDMFRGTSFNGNISDWDVSKVEDMYGMFRYSKFTSENGDISKWKVNDKCNFYDIFYRCPLGKNPPKWYKE